MRMLTTNAAISSETTLYQLGLNSGEHSAVLRDLVVELDSTVRKPRKKITKQMYSLDKVPLDRVGIQ
jgi:hypothetical protein